MNLKVVSRNVGIALLVSALFMLLSVGVSLIDGADSAMTPLLISFTITFIVGVFPFIFVRKTTRISLKDGYMIIALSWLLSFIFGALPMKTLPEKPAPGDLIIELDPGMAFGTGPLGRAVQHP